MTVRYEVGDTRAVVATLATGSIALVASSPAFLALRSYLPDDHPDKHAEIGSEPDPATFLDTLLELTAEWGRVLAPWGSIAIELGDTYAGAGGYGNPDSLNPAYGGPKTEGHFEGRTAKRFKRTDDGWPRAKSLALIPQLYATSLAYGRNLLTGQPSPAGQWLVRNVIVWHRPNPAVGALGDKVRPSTSYITVATRSPKRWFDLDAVRGALSPDPLGRGNPNGAGRNGDPGRYDSHPAGAPPLDCWFDHHDTWTLTTQPSRISTTTTERVPCGPDDGGERTTSPDCPVHGDRPDPTPTEHGDERADASSPGTPHTGSRPEPEPSPVGICDASTSSRSDQPAASARSTSTSRTVPAPSTSQPDTPSAQTAADTARTPTSPELFGADPGTPESNSDEACPPADEPGTAPHSDDMSDPLSACTCSFHLVKTSVHSHYAMWPAKLAERLILMMCPAEVCATCGEGRRRVTGPAEYVPSATYRGGSMLAASERVADGVNQWVGAAGAKASVVRQSPTLGWSDCGHGDYRPGVVLDPFCGSGTTMAAAEFHGRDAIGIDIDARNRDLYPARRDEVFRALNPTHVQQVAGQLDMFGEVLL